MLLRVLNFVGVSVWSGSDTPDCFLELLLLFEGVDVLYESLGLCLLLLKLDLLFESLENEEDSL